MMYLVFFYYWLYRGLGIVESINNSAHVMWHFSIVVIALYVISASVSVVDDEVKPLVKSIFGIISAIISMFLFYEIIRETQHEEVSKMFYFLLFLIWLKSQVLFALNKAVDEQKDVPK